MGREKGSERSNIREIDREKQIGHLPRLEATGCF